ETRRQVLERIYFRLEPRRACDQPWNVPAVVHCHQRALRVDGVRVVLRRLEKLDPTAHPTHAHLAMLDPGIDWSREDVCAPGLEGARDLAERRRRIDDVLQDVLSDDEIEGRVGERLALEVLAAHTVMHCAWVDVGPVVRPEVPWALALQLGRRHRPGRGFMG